MGESGMKAYRVVCEYSTVMNYVNMVKAKNVEEAKKKGLESFKRWNKGWMEVGGNEKRLTKLYVMED